MSTIAPAPDSKASAQSIVDPPAFEQLEKRVWRLRTLDFTLIGLILATNALLIVAIVGHTSVYSLFVTAILFTLSYFIHLGWTFALLAYPGAKLAALRFTEKVGSFKSGEIYLMVQELLEPHRGKEIPEVYITDGRHDGASVINSLFFNWIKPLNAIYISKHLFNILRPGEIKAVLAHELAHFYRHMQPLNRARFALMALNATLPLYLSLDDGSISLTKALSLWVAFSFAFISILNYWINRASKDFEYLCDLSAARRYGILNIVNGLICVVRMGEIQAKVARILLDRIERDDTLSVEKLSALVDKCEDGLSQTPLSTKDIERVLDEHLATVEGRKLRRKLSKRELKKEKQAIDEIARSLLLNQDFQLLDWKRFDNVNPDGRLNQVEYRQLIEILKDEPEGQLFDLSSDCIPNTKNGSHPTVAQRILFLEESRRKDPSIAL